MSDNINDNVGELGRIINSETKQPLQHQQQQQRVRLIFADSSDEDAAGDNEPRVIVGDTNADYNFATREEEYVDPLLTSEIGRRRSQSMEIPHGDGGSSDDDDRGQQQGVGWQEDAKPAAAVATSAARLPMRRQRDEQQQQQQQHPPCPPRQPRVPQLLEKDGYSWDIDPRAFEGSATEFGAGMDSAMAGMGGGGLGVGLGYASAIQNFEAAVKAEKEAEEPEKQTDAKLDDADVGEAADAAPQPTKPRPDVNVDLLDFADEDDEDEDEEDEEEDEDLDEILLIATVRQIVDVCKEQIAKKQKDDAEADAADDDDDLLAPPKAPAVADDPNNKSEAVLRGEEAASGSRFEKDFEECIAILEPALTAFDAGDMTLDDFLERTGPPMLRVQRVIRMWSRPPAAPKVVVDGKEMDF